MAYTSGSVTAFSGANGLLTALLNFVLGTEVSGESLSGSGTSWSGSLANSPVGLGRLVINYAFSSTNYEATDDGSGNITGTNISSGSITYSTGAYSITFTGTPDATPTADYIYGNEGQDWREEMNENTEDDEQNELFSGDCKQVVLSNTGLSGQEAVIIGIRETKYPAETFYAWNLNGYTTFNPAGIWDQNYPWHGLEHYNDTYENYDYHPSLTLADDTMYYWIYSNQQRIIVVAKVSSNYESCYLGFGRRFGNPGDYPFPMLVGGSNSRSYSHVSTSDYHTWFISTQRLENNYNVWLFDPTPNVVSWIGLTSQNRGTYVIPYDSWQDQSDLAPTNNGRRLFIPCYYTKYADDSSACYFDLDGIYLAVGTSMQSEDLVNYDGKRYRIFQNCFRTKYYQYMAIEEGAAVSTTTTTTTTTTTSTTTTT
jgi:hypothetical protein